MSEKFVNRIHTIMKNIMMPPKEWETSVYRKIYCITLPFSEIIRVMIMVFSVLMVGLLLMVMEIISFFVQMPLRAIKHIRSVWNGKSE